MSVQETKLKAIADAIREKDGTTAPIPAADFPARILALSAAPEGLHTITVEASDPDGGTVSGGGMASDGMVLTVEATAGDGYEFSGWQEGGTTVSPNTTYTFTATMDRTLVAAFEVAPQYVLGRDWWAATLPAALNWWGVAYGDGKFVAVSYGSNKSAYSTDGIIWTEATLPAILYWHSVAYGGGKFVVVSNSTIAAYSTDGIVWKSATLPAALNWRDVTYGDGKFVATANTSNKVAYSSAQGPAN